MVCVHAYMYPCALVLMLLMLPFPSWANDELDNVDCSNNEHFMETIPNTTTLFLTLSTQRSGSTWFVTNVVPTPFIQSRNEMLQQFHDLHRDTWSTISWENYVCGLRRAFQQTHDVWTASLNTYAKTEGKRECLFPRAFGFKIMYDQIPEHLIANLLGWAVTNGVKMVHLRRKASLLIHASRVASRSTGVYQNQEASPPKVNVVLTNTTAKVHALMNSLVEIETEQELWESHLTSHGVASIHIWYEDLLVESAPTINKFQHFISGDINIDAIPQCTNRLLKGTAMSPQHSAKCMDRVSDYSNVVVAMTHRNLRSGPACALLDSL
eukprot:m.70982 g.70982  ORF g.70982 m.70982 type:complete len:324 (-) comp24296_c0_seq3:205-1176(-)